MHTAPAAASSVLNGLPTDLGRHRILPTPQTCEFLGISIAQWRRLRTSGAAPAPIQIGIRKQGWRLGDLIDWLDRRRTVDYAART
jgi:predicted DNA-binding transcriptional regulator AlpA